MYGCVSAPQVSPFVPQQSARITLGVKHFSSFHRNLRALANVEMCQCVRVLHNDVKCFVSDVVTVRNSEMCDATTIFHDCFDEFISCLPTKP
eukprot:m.267815 g.267815  ORF g.267815 m.267815 type:complete len:92 (+) comp74986_c0_seq1:129-404(+)